jgi:transcriptional regulator GlxA family with amidase domain
MRPEAKLADEIAALIGEAAALALAEEFGGSRLYIPSMIEDGHRIAEAIGMPAARVLSARFAPDVVVVPLCRELRAAHYRGQGLSNGKIARRLGLTERGVERIFERLREGAAQC